MRQKCILSRMIRNIPDFVVKENTSYYLLKKNEILYFEDLKEYCRCVSIQGRSFRLSLSFREILSHEKFSGSFVPVNKWYVHVNYLKGIIRNDKEVRVDLTNGKKLLSYESDVAGQQ